MKDFKKKPTSFIANKSEDEMKEFIAKHLFERSFYYNQAKYIVTTDDKSPQETVLEIQSLLV